MRLPSASSIKLAMTCPASATLPQVGQVSEATELGTDVHEFLRLVGSGKTVAEALEQVPESSRAECRAVDVDAIPTLRDVRQEVAFVFNPWTGNSKILGENIGRDYERHGWVPTEEYPGTADRVGYVVGGQYDGWLCVDDYKTGNAYTVERANRNWQLKHLAVAASKALNERRVLVGIVRTKGRISVDYHPMEELDLDLAGQELLMLAEFIRTGKAQKKLVTGSHCTYCPAFNSCPTQTALLRKLSNAPELTVEGVVEALTNGDAAFAYGRYRAIKAAMSKMESAFRMYAERNPIVLDNGKVFGPTSKALEELDGRVVFETLHELYGPDVAKAAVTLDSSKAAIERAVAPIAPPRGKAAMVREVLKKVASEGGVSVRTRTEVREHHPGEDD
jgi:hypothetical protein